MTEMKPDGSLDIIEDDDHSLLNIPTYSELTVRRALAVWYYCGQRNRFDDVCNFYHQLEAYENTLTADKRAQSQRHEMDLFKRPPPTSEYQKKLFPDLYLYSHATPQNTRMFENTRSEQQSRLGAFKEVVRQNNTNDVKVLNTSMNIKKNYNSSSLTVRRFLDNFRGCTLKSEFNNAVENVASYIRKSKTVEAEVDIVQKIPTTFNFLEDTTDVSDECEDKNSVCDSIKTNDDNVIEKIFCKPKSLKYSRSTVTTSKITELNDNCAAFFKSFTARYIQKSWNFDKTISYLTLTDIKDYIRKEKKKSQSVEMLTQNNMKIECRPMDLISHFLNAHNKNGNVKIKIAL